jgi:hypothetical protein
MADVEAANKTLQVEKKVFAASQDPPIDPCGNTGCKFTGCTCGDKCGCDQGDGTSCDPCQELKAKKKAQRALEQQRLKAETAATGAAQGDFIE